MEQNEDKLPRFSYDLITYLDGAISTPKFPANAEQFAALDEGAMRRAAFTAGARSVVDWLLMWRAEEEEAASDGQAIDTGVPDGPELRFPRVLGQSGSVREDPSSVPMAEVRVASILVGGGDEE